MISTTHSSGIPKLYNYDAFECAGIRNKFWSLLLQVGFSIRSYGPSFECSFQKWTNPIQLAQWQWTNFMHALLYTLK